MSKSRAVYPGTFDPVTYGHIDLVKRALKMFDEVIVGCAIEPDKDLLFSIDERVSMLKQATGSLKRVKVYAFDSLAVKFAQKHKASTLIRGVRMISDFEYEFQMALTNRRLAPGLETIFLMPSESHSFVSSRLIKEAAKLGADVSSFVPKFVAKKLYGHYK